MAQATPNGELTCRLINLLLSSLFQMLTYSVGVEFYRTTQVLKEKEYFLVVWFHIVNLLFWLLFFILTFSLPSLSWFFKLLNIKSWSHCVSYIYIFFFWQRFFRQRFSVFRIKQCTRTEPWNWDAAFLLIRLQRFSGLKTGHLSKWHLSLWDSRTLAKAESFVQVSITWIIMLASCWYVHLHMLVKLVFTRVKLLTGKGQVMPRLSWMFWVRANLRTVKWTCALKIIQTCGLLLALLMLYIDHFLHIKINLRLRIEEYILLF